MRLSRHRTATVWAIVIGFAAGASVAILASSKALDGLEWKIFDRYQYMSRNRISPRDLLVIFPEKRGNTGNPSADETLQAFRLLDEFEIGSLALEGPAFEGGLEREELAALRAEIPGLVDRECANIEENIRALFSAIRSGSIPARELSRYVNDLTGIVEKGGERIKEASSKGQSPTLRALETESDRFRVAGDSFFGTQADPDGITRRILVIKKDGERILPRVELAALMARFGNPELMLEQGRLRLIGASLPGGESRDIVIRIDDQGRALLGWPIPAAGGGSRELSLSELFDAIADERSFLLCLETMETGGLLVGEGAALLSRYRHSERLREESSPDDAAAGADWRESRREFFTAALAYFNGNHDADLITNLEVGKTKPDLSVEELAAIDERMRDIESAYKEAQGYISKLAARRAALSDSLRSSFVFLSLRDENRPVITGFGMTASPAHAGAAFVSAALSGSTPYSISSSSQIAIALALVAATAITGSLFGSIASLIVILAGMVCSLGAFAAQGAFLPPLPLVLGTCVAAISSFAFSRGGIFGRGGGARKRVAVVVCRASGLLRAIEGLSPEEAGRVSDAFRKAARVAVEREGGMLAASDGATMLSCFEERKGAKAAADRALKAAFALARANLVSGAESGICIGIDSGDCLIAGKALIGPTVDLAMRLADLNVHYGTTILATGALLETAGGTFSGSRLGELEVEATGRKAEFYDVREAQDRRG